MLGLIADTHGYLGEDAVAALRGCERILHAGDIGPCVLERLRELAPVTAVRGNNDLAGEPAELPAVATIEAQGARIALVHRLADAPPPDEWDVLVFGHCHRRHADFRDGRLLLNPGAAGRRGFHRERSVALLDFAPGPTCRFVDLGPRSAGR